MEVGYASTRRGTCLVCSKPIMQRALQVGVEIDERHIYYLGGWSQARCHVMLGRCCVMLRDVIYVIYM